MLAAARLDLEPAGPEAINSAVRDVLSGLPSKKQGDGDAKSALLIYRIGLKELPVDVLRLACERATKVCEWRPPPATLLKLVDDEMAARRRRLTRLQHATDRPPMPERIISDAERQAVIDGFEALQADLDRRNREAAAKDQSQQHFSPMPRRAAGSTKDVVAAALAAARKSQPGDA